MAIDLKNILLKFSGPPDDVLGDYINHIANGGLTHYRRVVQWGNKEGQPLYAHVIDLVFTFARLAEPLGLTPSEQRVVMLALSAHDINKVLGGDRPVRFADQAQPAHVAPELERLGAEGFFPEWSVYILRQPRQKISLSWRNLPKHGSLQWDQTTFTRCFVNGAPIAIKGLVIGAEEPLPDDLRRALEQDYVPVLLIPQSKRGILQRAIAQRPVYPRKLTIRIGQQDEEFQAILGTNALLMSPLLWWLFQLERRKEETAIIC